MLFDEFGLDCSRDDAAQLVGVGAVALYCTAACVDIYDDVCCSSESVVRDDRAAAGGHEEFGAAFADDGWTSYGRATAFSKSWKGCVLRQIGGNGT